jgi:CelD/BcsL family acetyltransferase involved in cellulose biosynthesis
MNTSTWKLCLLTEWDEISTPEFVQHWTALMEKSDDAHVFFHPVIVQAWIETYRPLRDIRPLFVQATQGEQEVIFPLVLWRRNWKNGFIRMVVPAGYSDFDYHDPLFRHKPDTSEIKSFYQALLQKLDADLAYDRMLLDGLHRQYLPPYGKVVNSEICLASLLKGKECNDGMIWPIQKSQEKANKRRFRRFNELGNIQFRRFDATEKTIMVSSLGRMLEMHTIRWPHAYKAPGFHERLFIEGVQAGLIDFLELTLDGKCVAWQISFIYKKRYSLYMPAVDTDFYKYSLGQLMLGYVFCQAVKNGFELLDHLRGAEEYKNAWGGEETMIYDVAYDTRNILSALRRTASSAICKAASILNDAGHRNKWNVRNG